MTELIIEASAVATWYHTDGEIEFTVVTPFGLPVQARSVHECVVMLDYNLGRNPDYGDTYARWVDAGRPIWSEILRT